MPIDDLKLIKNLFTVVETDFADGDNLARGASKMLILTNPGIGIYPETDESDIQSLKNQTQKLDQLLNASFVYDNKIGTFSTLYWTIVEKNMVPIFELNKGEQQELERLNAWLLSNASIYQKQSDAYNDALDEYKAVIRKDPGDPAQDKFSRKAQAADDAFILRNPYGNARSRKAQLEKGNTEQRWTDLLGQKARTRQVYAGREFWPVKLDPPVSSWQTAQWANISYEVNDSQSTSTSSATGWSGGVSSGWGLWCFGLNAEHHVENRYIQASTRHYKISFSFKRVHVIRDWCDSSVLTDTFWAWDYDKAPNKLVSTGFTANGPPPTGLCPIYYEDLLVVKDVTIEASFDSTEYNFHRDHSEGGASSGFGPFSFGGSWDEDHQNEHRSSQMLNGKLTIPDPQIIGFYGIVVPLLPNPDPSIAAERWPKPLKTPTSDAMAENRIFALRVSTQIAAIDNYRRITENSHVALRENSLLAESQYYQGLQEAKLAAGSRESADDLNNENDGGISDTAEKGR